jgi:ribonuclease P protein component
VALVPPTTPPATTFRFPKDERIAKRREFLEIYDSGRKQFGRFTVVFVRPNSLGHPRIGITVTKKAGKSHVRNRLRRWTRETFRIERGLLGTSAAPVDLVVNVKPSAAAATFTEFSEDFRRSLSRILKVKAG